MAKVDVIIPAYNAASFLAAALESVIAQTFTDWQIVLVDDGSTDHSAQIISQFKLRLTDKLQWITQANAGLPAARNVAIRASSSEFIALLDADDLWLPNRLEASLRSFESRPDVGLSYGLNDQINIDGEVTRTFERRERYPEGKVAGEIYRRTMDLPCPTVTFRRRSVEDVGFFDESLRATEDRDLWLRIAQLYEVAVVPEVIAHYRVSPMAMTTNPDRMFEAQRKFIEKHYRTPGCGFLARRAALSSIYRQRAEALAGRRQPVAAMKDGWRAALLYPAQVVNWRTAMSLSGRLLASKIANANRLEAGG